MKPKTLVLCVIAVLLLAGAAWQLADGGQPDAVKAPELVAEEPAAAPEIPIVAAVVPAADDPANDAAMAAGKPPIKRTQLPDGKILIENQPLTLRHADGRVEERLVRMVAKPVKQKVAMKRPFPGKEKATEAPQADPNAEAPAAVQIHAPGTGSPGSDEDDGSGGGGVSGDQSAPTGGGTGAGDKPGDTGTGATPK